jgi:hypothetical protein
MLLLETSLVRAVPVESLKHPTQENRSVLVAVAALDTLDEIFEEVVVTSVLDTDFTLLVLITLEEVDLGLLEDVLVDLWLETDDDVVDFRPLEDVVVDSGWKARMTW